MRRVKSKARPSVQRAGSLDELELSPQDLMSLDEAQRVTLLKLVKSGDMTVQEALAHVRLTQGGFCGTTASLRHCGSHPWSCFWSSHR